ncbi:unnamed protein product [Cuscuta campestris]|uniref:CCHC-type domain-containing protein n=1 Tax=Cuscuta campestris TaxID=132261 RepID=A0A484LE78_9ASTE|nr:unnamed protein product [Cuscuta campestris]
MSQAAGNDGQAVPEGEPDHVSVHTEASSFTPQQAPEQATPGAGPVLKASLIIQPQFAANFMNFLQQMDSAYDSWKRVGADVPEPVPWAIFEQLFYDEYIPEHFVEAKREEFLKFTQGELTLPEYRQKFDELAGFGQDLIPTMKKRCKRFVEGLRPDLSGHLIIARWGDINALYKNALDLNAALIKKAEYEQSQERSAAPSRLPPSQKAGASSKRSIATPSTSHQSKKVKSAPTQSSAFVQKKGKSGDGYRYPICNLCGRRHPGECWFTQGLCLECGQAGHFRKECPKNPALIDPGSTLSYVCMPIPVMPNIPREDLDNPVIVSNPLGHSLRITRVYHDCPLVVQGKTFPANLIELPHREFDVILGMDWLTTNQSVVDCGAHTVRLRAEDGSDILICGELLPKALEFISYIHAHRLIRKKCEAFLCTVCDARLEAPSRGDIPTPTLRQQIASAQSGDEFCVQTIELVSRGEKPNFTVQDDIEDIECQLAGPMNDDMLTLQNTHRSSRVWSDPAFADKKVSWADRVIKPERVHPEPTPELEDACEKLLKGDLVTGKPYAYGGWVYRLPNLDGDMNFTRFVNLDEDDDEVLHGDQPLFSEPPSSPHMPEKEGATSARYTPLDELIRDKKVGVISEEVGRSLLEPKDQVSQLNLLLDSAKSEINDLVERERRLEVELRAEKAKLEEERALLEEERARSARLEEEGKRKVAELEEALVQVEESARVKEESFPDDAANWAACHHTEVSRSILTKLEDTMDFLKVMYKEPEGKRMITEIGSYGF